MLSSSRPSTLRLTLILGTLTAFAPISIDMYLPGLPSIAQDFGTATAMAQLTLSIFFTGLAFGQAFYGPISDRVGRKIPLLAGCALYTLASIGCSLAPTIESLIAFRLLQALGGCAGVVIARSIVRDLFEGRDIARMFSFLTLVMGLAPILAPLLGGQLLAFVGWRAIFWVLTGFGILCLVMVAFGLPESLPDEHRTRAGLGHALRVYGNLLADRQFIGYALSGGLISAGMFAYISGSPFVIIELYGVAPQHFGWIFGANAAGLIAASQLNAVLLRHYHNDTILRTALVIVTIAGCVLTLVAATGIGGLPGLLIPLFVCIACVGLVQPNATASAMAPYGRQAGSASALLGTLQFVAGACASALVSAFANGTALPMTAVIAGCEAVALITFLVLVGRSTPQHDPTQQALASKRQ